MSRVRLTMMALLAVLAVSAVAASASMAAAPEFLNEKGANPTGSFTSKSGQTSLWSKADKTQILCAADTAKGKFTGAKTVQGIITLTGCEGINKKTETKCKVNSPKAAAGEVVTNELKGELGTVNKAAKEVGLLLKPVTGSSFVTLEGTCLPATPANVEGSVICKVEPIEVFSITGKLVCTENGEEQSIKKFEGGSEQTLKVFGLAAAIEGTEEVTFEEKIKTTSA